MATKTSDWRPGPTVCRCCLSEGCYKDISTEYFWMGKREVYAEMLSDTLNLTIAYSKSGPNSNSRLICEPCISRLRDAHDFRRQVVECEKTFMQHLDPGSSILQKELEMNLEEVKVEQVKQEKKASDDEDFDDRIDFVVDNDDTDDDLDDEPLMKLATKVPKKEKEVDLLDLLDNSQVTVKRKSTASSSKAKEPPAKKAKKQIVIKPSASKATASASKPGEKKKKEKNLPRSEKRKLSIQRRNAKILVHNCTIYPFKLPRSEMACVFCDEEFDEPPLFRLHMKENHFDDIINFPSLFKVDCTESSCRICSQSFDGLESSAQHLKNEHGCKIDLDSSLGLVPFVLPNRKWTCAICKERITTLRALSKHMSMVHFSAVTCEECGKSFANSRTYDLHVNSYHKKIFACRGCREIFPNSEERSAHYMESRPCWQSVCHICEMRFRSGNCKEKHLQEVHNIFSKNLICTECGEKFPNSKECRKHFRIQHTDDKLCCSYCPKMFVSKSRLKWHTVTHTKEKLLVCTMCGKALSNANSLNQHMWIHRKEKRFKCKSCNIQFNQKVTWKAHMDKYHLPITVRNYVLLE